MFPIKKKLAVEAPLAKAYLHPTVFVLDVTEVIEPEPKPKSKPWHAYHAPLRRYGETLYISAILSDLFREVVRCKR